MDKSQIIVAIEGIDGAGKTTLIDEICGYLGEKVVVYKRTSKGKVIDRLVSSAIMQKHYMMQVPIYLMLSYKNYILFRKNNRTNNKIIIMDRCFLSNICYFYPKALKKHWLLRVLLFFEVKLFPQKIFILDVDSRKGQIRDLNRKSLGWLKVTRNAYLEATNSLLTKFWEIEIIPEELGIVQKRSIVVNYIEGEERNGN